MKTRMLARLALLGALILSLAAIAAAEVPVESMLTDWVVDFRSDPVAATPVVFGVRVGDASSPDWRVVVSGEQAEDGSWGVELHSGFPDEPCAFFITDAATLARLHSGELASLTAMGKAWSTDFAPLDLDFTDGFAPTDEAVQHLIKLAFHFWTRGTPEIVHFGNLDSTRELHGANATLFYYQEGFRSGWFSIGKGQHVNAEEKSQTNPFPTLVIMTRGQVTAKIGGIERMLSEGETVYIGPGVTHEFWNDADQRGEGILVMFGEGA